MSIDNTEHLSKLSKEEINAVYKKWPSPLMPLGFMIGGLIPMMFVVSRFNPDQATPADTNALIGSATVFIVLTLGSSIYNLAKLSKAKKVLNGFAEQHSLPAVELFKEFRRNLKHVKAL